MDLNPDFRAAEPDPTLFETGAAAFNRSTLASIIYQPLAAERMAPTDQTPVSDAEIEQRLVEERLVTADQLATGQGQRVLQDFTNIATKGQLEAQVNKFKFARDNDAILAASSTPAWLASQAVAGILDPSTLIPGTLGAKVVGKPLLEIAGKFAAGAAVQAAVTEGERAVFDPAHETDPASLLVNIGGATILGGFLGVGLTKLLPHSEQVRLGDGIKKELIGALDGTLEKDTAKLGETISEKTRQYASGELSNPALEKELEAKFGEKPTPSQLALADSLGQEAMARVGSKLLGKSIPLEMIHSDSAVAQNFAGDAFMLRGALEKDGVPIYSPESIYAQKGIVDGHLGQARQTHIEAWKEWAADQAVYSGVIERNMSGAWKKTLGIDSNDTHLAAFSDLVAKAVAFNSDRSSFGPELNKMLDHPAIKKAADGYIEFENRSFDMLKRAGLITEDRRLQDHIRHVYNQDQIFKDQGRVIQTEAHYAAKHHFEQTVAASSKKLEAAETQAHNSFVNDTEAITNLLEQASLDGTVPRGKPKAGYVGAFQKRLRESLNDFNERFANEYADAVKASAKQQDIAERRLERVSMNKPMGWFDKQVANLNADMSAKLDAERLRIRDKHYNAMISKFDTAEQNALQKLKTKLDTSLEEARAEHAANTSLEAYGRSAVWGRDHAEGNFKAVVYGATGNGSGGVGLTGGNVRSTRLARNYFTPTRVLLENNWLDTDVLKIMDKTARQDMMDAIVARKFRRPMTADEQALLAKDSPEAYWKHGDDRSTVPDLAMSHVKEQMVNEYMQKGVKLSDLGDYAKDFAQAMKDGRLRPAEDGNIMVGNIGSTAKERAKGRDLIREATRMLEYVDHTRDTMRGTHTYDNVLEGINPAINAAKTLAFTSYLGTSVLTNTMDATRLATYHGIGTTLQYVGARLAEKLNDKALFKDIGRKELREQASAIGFGLEQFHNVRAQGLAGVADPFANSGRPNTTIGNVTENITDTMSQMGSKVFLLEYWDNFIKTAAYGLTQYRLSKLALADPKTHSAVDQEWMRYIGMTPEKLSSVRAALNNQGITEIKGSELGRIKLNQWDDVRAKEAFLSSVNHDVTTAVVQPNQGNAGLFLQRPLLSVITQFQSFAQEAAGSINLRAGQQAAAGQYGMLGQTVLGLATGALMTYYLKGLANGDLDKRTAAFEKTPGQVAYQLIDYSGAMPLLTNANNFVENVTSIGLKRGAAALAGDRGLLLGNSGGGNRNQFKPDATALAGPFGRVISDYSNAANSIAEGKFDEKAQNRLSRSLPFNNAVPFKFAARAAEAVTGQGLDAFRASRGTREAIENSGITALGYALPFAQNRRN